MDEMSEAGLGIPHNFETTPTEDPTDADMTLWLTVAIGLVSLAAAIGLALGSR